MFVWNTDKILTGETYKLPRNFTFQRRKNFFQKFCVCLAILVWNRTTKDILRYFSLLFQHPVLFLTITDFLRKFNKNETLAFLFQMWYNIIENWIRCLSRVRRGHWPNDPPATLERWLFQEGAKSSFGPPKHLRRRPRGKIKVEFLLVTKTSFPKKEV